MLIHESKINKAVSCVFFAPILFVLKALKCQTDNSTQTEAYFQMMAGEKGLVLRSASEQEKGKGYSMPGFAVH